MKLSKLACILNAIEAASDNAEVCVYLNEKAPLDIDHLQVMLDSEGNVSEVWLEVTE